jgi:hypothetical protein
MDMNELITSVKCPKTCMTGGNNCNQPYASFSVNKGCPSYKTLSPSEVAWDARMNCDMSGGVSHDIKELVNMYLDAIFYYVNRGNLREKFNKIFDKKFKFTLEANGKEKVGTKRDFATYFLEYHNMAILTFSLGRNKLFEQTLTSKNSLIDSIKEKVFMSQSKLKIQSGGEGYYYAVGVPPIGKQPVVKSYLEASRPYFPNNNQCAGYKKKRN